MVSDGTYIYKKQFADFSSNVNMSGGIKIKKYNSKGWGDYASTILSIIDVCNYAGILRW